MGFSSNQILMQQIVQPAQRSAFGCARSLRQPGHGLPGPALRNIEKQEHFPGRLTEHRAPEHSSPSLSSFENLPCSRGKELFIGYPTAGRQRDIAHSKQVIGFGQQCQQSPRVFQVTSGECDFGPLGEILTRMNLLLVGQLPQSWGLPPVRGDSIQLNPDRAETA